MMKIVEYKTVTADNWTALDKEVNRLLSLGYQLYGNPYFGDSTLAQAMIKGGMREPVPPVETTPTTTIAP